MTLKTFAALAVTCLPFLDAGLPLGPAASGAEPAEIRFLDVKSGCRMVHAGTLHVADGVIQVRRRAFLDRSRNVTGFPGADARIFSVVDSDADPKTSDGKAWGTFVRVYDTIPATIYGTYSGVIVGGVFSGAATGRGTGSLEGYRFDAVVRQMTIAELPGGDPCPPPGSLHKTGQTLDSTLTLDGAAATP